MSRHSIQTKPLKVGVLGAGQLALMLAQASRHIGIEVICAGDPGDCAAQAAFVSHVDLSSAAEVAAFAAQCDLVTLESENIAADVLQGLPLYPNANVVRIAQDRLLEKQFFQQCGVEVAPFQAVNSVPDLEAAIRALGLPAILKTRRMGYDGKGQVRLQTGDDSAPALASALADVSNVFCILEGMISFQSEVSLIAARSRSGETVFYPLIENVHREGILRRSTVPSHSCSALQAQAEQSMETVLSALDYIGVLAIEFFVVDGRLVANEMAPRVHNSGHWTIEGASTSQFENHLRAIAGMELGSTQSLPTVMLNCIGSMPTLADTSAFPTLTRHDYGKQSRPGRKVGHLSFPAADLEVIREWQRRLSS